jgi:hypothetical protein
LIRLLFTERNYCYGANKNPCNTDTPTIKKKSRALQDKIDFPEDAMTLVSPSGDMLSIALTQLWG